MPMPAARPQQTPIDFGPYLERMEEFAPEPEDRREFMQDRVWANLSKALAAGAMGSGHSGGWGPIARAGAGFGTAQAATTEDWLQQEEEYEQAERAWGLQRLNLEMQLQQEANNMAYENEQIKWQSGEDARQVQIANDTATYNRGMKQAEIDLQVEQQNADRFYDWENQVGVLTQSKVLPGTGKDVIAIQHITPDGESKIEYRRFDDPSFGGSLDNQKLNALQDIRDLWGDDSDAFKRSLYAPLIATDNHLDYRKLMAEELLKTVSLEEFFGEDVADQVNERAEALVSQGGTTVADPDKYAIAVQSCQILPDCC